MLLIGVKQNHGIPAFRIGGAVANPAFLRQVTNSSQGQLRKTEPATDVLVLKCLQVRITINPLLCHVPTSNQTNKHNV